MKKCFCALLVLTACGPRTQEDCLSNAAKNAQTPLDFRVAKDVCEREFPAKKWEDGRYVFFDLESRTSFEVRGPKLSEAEKLWVKETREAVRRNKTATLLPSGNDPFDEFIESLTPPPPIRRNQKSD